MSSSHGPRGMPAYRAQVRRARWRVGASAAAVAALPFLLQVLVGRRFFGIDLSFLDVPTACAFRLQLAGDQGALLSPWLGNGGALFARPEAQLLYPPRWLSALFEPELGASLMVVVHVAIAAAGACVLAGTWRLRPGAALLAGLLYAWSGVFLETALHNVYLAGAAMLPWVWAAGRRALRARAAAPLVHLALATALAFVAMEPQSLLVVALLLSADALHLLVQPPTRGRAERMGNVATAAGAATAGALVGLLPWLPALAELTLSPRGSYGPAMLLKWGFDVGKWPALLWPNLLEEPLLGSDLAFFIAEDHWASWGSSAYLGATVMCLALVGAWRQPKLAAAGAFFAVLAVGRVTPVMPALIALGPPFALFRYPAKYLVPVALAVALLAASGAQRLRRDKNARRRYSISALALGAGCLTACVAVVVIGRSALVDGGDAGFVAAFAWATACTLGPLALGLVALTSARARWAVGVCAAGSLLWAAPHVLPSGAPLLPIPSALSLVDLGHSPSPNAHPPTVCVSPKLNATVGSAVATARNWEAMRLKRRYAAEEWQACDGMSSAIAYSVVKADAAARLGAAGTQQASRALGCAFVMALGEDAEPGLVPVPGQRVTPSGPVLFAVEHPTPLAFIAKDPVQAPDADAAVAAVLGAPDGAALLAVVDDPLHVVRALPDGRDARVGTVAWARRDHATVEVLGHGGAVIGLNTAFLAGWTAQQNGRPLPTLRSGGALLAAAVDDVSAGPIEFEYKSPHLALSLLVAALGVALCAVLYALRVRATRAGARSAAR